MSHIRKGKGRVHKEEKRKTVIEHVKEVMETRIRPFELARDRERVSRYHTELNILQNQMWSELAAQNFDPREMRRALERRQDGANWVRQLAMVISRKEAMVLMVDTPKGDPVGYIFVTETFDPGSLERIGLLGEVFIEEAFRGLGAGRQAVTAAEKWLQERGIKSFQVFVTKSNAEAVSLYEGSGYQVFDYRMVKRLSP